MKNIPHYFKWNKTLRDNFKRNRGRKNYKLARVRSSKITDFSTYSIRRSRRNLICKDSAVVCLHGCNNNWLFLEMLGLLLLWLLLVFQAYFRLLLECLALLNHFLMILPIVFVYITLKQNHYLGSTRPLVHPHPTNCFIIAFNSSQRNHKETDVNYHLVVNHPLG